MSRSWSGNLTTGRPAGPLDFPGYEVTAEIRTTRFSVLHRARRVSSGDDVAIKAFRFAPDVPLDQDAIPLEDWRSRFVVGGKWLAESNHPNIIKVLEVSDANRDTPYLVMPYVAETLVSEIGPDPASGNDDLDAAQTVRPRALPVERAFALAGQLADALAYLHDRGLVHRDLKPGNLLMAETGGDIMLADFGMVKLPDGAGPPERPVGFGSPDYTAPEQVSDAGTADARADVFAWAVITYRMLTGALPIGAFASLRNAPMALPQGLADLVGECLSSDPSARPASGAEIRRRLSGLGPAPDRPISKPPKSGKELRRRKAEATRSD